MELIQSKQNGRIKQWRKLQTAKGRRQQNKYLIEGKHLIEEAIDSKQAIEAILLTENFLASLMQDELETMQQTGAELVQISETVLTALAFTEQSQGIVASIRIEENLQSDHLNLKGKRYLLCDQIQDPGNLGTMIRTADAAGFDGVLLSEGTVDLYNDKVLRATQGSIWHLPIIQKDNESLYQALTQAGLPIYVTALHQEAVSYLDIASSRGVIVVGNEGQGVSEDWIEKADQKVFIPMSGKAESLNVAIAAGILMFNWLKDSHPFENI